MEVISFRMGPDPTPLASSQKETRTQMFTKERQTEDTRRHHLRAKEQGLKRKQTCTQLGPGLTALNSEERKCLSCAVYGTETHTHKHRFQLIHPVCVLTLSCRKGPERPGTALMSLDAGGTAISGV